MQKLNPYLRFAVIYLGTMVVIGTLFWIIESFSEISAGSAASAVLPLISGMMAGQYAARETGEAITKERMWRDAFVFNLVAVITSLLPVIAFLVATGYWDAVLALATRINPTITVIAIVIAFLLSFLMIRFGYGMGIRNELKAIDKRAG